MCFQGGGIVRLYFYMSVIQKTITEDYTLLSTVGEIGGYVGLLLGVAVVDFIYIIDRVWPMIFRL